MPACASRSLRDSPNLPEDERGVSEVIGYILVFGILSMILILAMVAFGVIHGRAESAAVAVEGQSAAQRVASSVVNAALFVERYPDAAGYVQGLDLPEQLEGNAYVVYLEPANVGAGDCTPCPSPPTCGHAAQVRICVPALGDSDIVAPLFSADASAAVTICGSQAPGGRVQVEYDAVPDCISLVGLT